MAFPYARMSVAQAEVLVAHGKLSEVDADVPLAHCSGWLLEQEKKRRLRPIFEPATNATLRRDLLPPCLFPSRAEMRRRFARHSTYSCQIDLAAYYDQLPIPPELRKFYGIRVRCNDGTSRFFLLTRVPMGACWSCGFAASITDVLAASASSPLVDVQTCIDNIRISSRDGRAFLEALRSLTGCATRMGISVGEVNGHESTTAQFTSWSDRGDADVLADCAQYARDHTWLGEHYGRDSNDEVVVSNTQDAVGKLQAAWHRIAAARGPDGHVSPEVSRRHVAALIGLLIWMAHTVNLPLCQFWIILRLASAIGFAATNERGWDQPVGWLSPRVVDALATAVALLTTNEPRPPLSPRAPSVNPTDYDVVICCDASAVGWAAIIWKRFVDGQGVVSWRATEASAGWSAATAAQHSAHAEPLAVDRALEFVEKRFGVGSNIAILTDHRAIVAAARRPTDLHGGFSPSANLNAMFARAYSHAADVRVPPRRDFFYIPGEENVADAASRVRGRGPWLMESAANIDMPCLATFWSG